MSSSHRGWSLATLMLVTGVVVAGACDPPRPIATQPDRDATAEMPDRHVDSGAVVKPGMREAGSFGSAHDAAPAFSADSGRDLDDGSLFGVDANDDGVRDDVEVLIEERHPDSARARAGLSQVAKAMQDELRAAEDPFALGQVLLEVFRAVECMRVVRGNEGYADVEWLHASFYNTKERVFRYIKAQNTAPGVGYEVMATPRPTACDFDPSSLPD